MIKKNQKITKNYQNDLKMAKIEYRMIKKTKK